MRMYAPKSWENEGGGTDGDGGGGLRRGREGSLIHWRVAASTLV
jgi:hypothetical protein